MNEKWFLETLEKAEKSKKFETETRKMSQTALQYVLNNDVVLVTIQGAKTAFQVEQNADASKKQQIRNEEINAIKEIFPIL